MSVSLLRSYNHHYHFKLFWSHYWSICGALHRKQDLQQLVTWAKRKKFTHPLARYQQRLIDEEHRLWWYQVRSPWASYIAHLAVGLNSLLTLTSQPEYRRGYASRYK